MGANVPAAGATVNLTLRVTRITATGRAVKRHDFGEGGTIATDSAPQVWAGTGDVVTLPATLPALAEFFSTLGSDQCVTYGVPRNGVQAFTLTTTKRAADSPGAIARTRENFEWGDGLAVLFLDHDPSSDGALAPQALVDLLVAVVPALRNVRWLMMPSSSSCIATEDGRELRGLRGFHLYALIEAKKVEAFAEHLREALAAAGHVRFDITKAGSLVERGPVDFAVFQPERIDYAAPPVIGPGLRLFGRDAQLLGGDVDVIDVDAVTPLTDVQRESALRHRAAARAGKEDDARRVREARIAADVDERAKREPSTPREVIEREVRAVYERRELGPGVLLPLLTATGAVEWVSVRDVLRERERFDRREALDLEDPRHRGGAQAAILLLDGDHPVYFTQAHGGITYDLHARPTIVLRAGALDEFVEEAVDALAESGDIYAFGAGVAIVDEGLAVPVAGPALSHEAERRVRCMAWKRPPGRPGAGGGELVLCPANFPREASERIAGNGRLLGRLPRLVGVRPDPLIWPSGRIVCANGFDAASGLYFTVNGFEPLPEMPSDDDVRSWVDTLMAPVSAYTFAGDVDRSTTLVAMLTAVARRTLPLAPAFVVRSSMRGSGKTLLALVVAELAGRVDLVDLTSGADELAKRVDAFQLGGGDALLADNLRTGEELAEECIATMLTSETKSIRPFGKNDRTIEVDTRRFLIATANNPRLIEDAARRVLPIEIRPKSASPHTATFPFDPLERARATRTDMVRAALGLLRAGLEVPAGAMLGSFSAWSSFVGGALECARRAGVEGLAPFASIVQATAVADPTADALNGLVDTLGEARLRGKGITVAELGIIVTDGFGKRAAGPGDAGVEMAGALDLLANACRTTVWGRDGRFNPTLAGRLLAGLRGRLFERDHWTWVCDYPERGRDRQFRVLRGTA